MWEDEALGVLCGFAMDTKVQELIFLGVEDQSLEHYLAATLTTMKNVDKSVYDSLPDATVDLPNLPTRNKLQGSINLD